MDKKMKCLNCLILQLLLYIKNINCIEPFVPSPTVNNKISNMKQFSHNSGLSASLISTNGLLVIIFTYVSVGL
jgi:hypothetical protein